MEGRPRAARGRPVLRGKGREPFPKPYGYGIISSKGTGKGAAELLQADYGAFLEGGLPFWKKLDDAQRARLRETVTARRYERGETMHAGSEDCAGLFLVKEGQVRVYILSDGGKEITLYRLFPWDICIFSASCMLRNISFDVYVEAEKETDALLIPTTVYSELSKESLAVSDYTNQLMSSRFSDVMWVMEQVLFMSFDKRLALFLLEQAEIEGTDRLAMTQEAIARNLGSAREVVTRMLKYFQSEGLVSLFRGGVEITGREGLEALSKQV